MGLGRGDIGNGVDALVGRGEGGGSGPRVGSSGVLLEDRKPGSVLVGRVLSSLAVR